MKHNQFKLVAVSISVIYWLMDSLIHRFLYSEDAFELIPSDLNELSMRLIIIFLLVIFGLYADIQTNTLLKKEREKNIVFNAVVKSSQHILNNLLTKMQYFKMKAESSGSLDDETKDLFDLSLKEAEKLVTELAK